MEYKAIMHRLIADCADVLLAYVKQTEPHYNDRWVPAATIKKELGINLLAVPRANATQGAQGWFFATLARLLEDQGRLEYQTQGARAFCRSVSK